MRNLESRPEALDRFDLLEGRSAFLEGYARRMIFEEETHVGDVEKMLRKPG